MSRGEGCQHEVCGAAACRMVDLLHWIAALQSVLTAARGLEKIAAELAEEAARSDTGQKPGV